jgi:hypothetical protein
LGDGGLLFRQTPFLNQSGRRRDPGRGIHGQQLYQGLNPQGGLGHIPEQPEEDGAALRCRWMLAGEKAEGLQPDLRRGGLVQRGGGGDGGGHLEIEHSHNLQGQRFPGRVWQGEERGLQGLQGGAHGSGVTDWEGTGAAIHAVERGWFDP